MSASEKDDGPDEVGSEPREAESSPASEPTPESDGSGHDRRGFLARASGIGAGLGLTLGYGAFAVTAGKYLYPANGARRAWMFVRELAALRLGDSMDYIGPQGETIAIARLASEGDVSDFVALSTVCPHLGCQVSWQAENKEFFCPCHNGVFDATGVGTSGPPAKAGQSLSRYPLKIENDLLFIEVPMPDARASREAPSATSIALADGRDACLGPQPSSAPCATRTCQAPSDEADS